MPYLSARDAYLLGLQWFEGQAALEQTGGQPNYEYVSDQTAQVATIVANTFEVSDELTALSERLSSEDPNVDSLQTRQLQTQAQQDFNEGRYQDALTLVNQAQDALTQAESNYAESNTLLESAQKNLEVFLYENYQAIIICLVALVVVIAITQKHIRRMLIHTKIRTLKAERVVLENMIKELQRDYFEKAKVNELSYHIKTKKYNELILNTDRQIPLLIEELKKL
jgi:hypothetical protein